MKKRAVRSTALLSVVLFALLFFCSQSAQQDPLSLIPGILNDLDLSTSSLEANIAASNKIISGLLLTNNSMRAIIETQQRQLNQESENSANWERIARGRSQEYEQTLRSLEASLIASSRENAEKDGKILKLAEANAAQTKAIFIMGGIIAAVLAFFIIKFILWIKGGAAVSLAKKLLGK